MTASAALHDGPAARGRAAGSALRTRPSVRRPSGTRVLAWAAGAVVVALLAGLSWGLRPVVLLSDSMAPAAPAGSLLVVEPILGEDVVVGDILTVERGQAVVSHRVTAIETVRGQRFARTAGDANERGDRERVPLDEGLVRRTLVVVPGVGRVLVGPWPAVLAGLALLLAAAWVLRNRVLPRPSSSRLAGHSGPRAVETLPAATSPAPSEAPDGADRVPRDGVAPDTAPSTAVAGAGPSATGAVDASTPERDFERALAELLAEAAVPLRPADAEPVVATEPDPFEPEPEPEPVASEPEPVAYEPALPEPVEPEPVACEPALPEPALPEPDEPEPVEPGHMAAEPAVPADVARHLELVVAGRERGLGPLEQFPEAVAADDRVVWYLLALVDGDVAGATAATADSRSTGGTVLHRWLGDVDDGEARSAA